MLPSWVIFRELLVQVLILPVAQDMLWAVLAEHEGLEIHAPRFWVAVATRLLICGAGAVVGYMVRRRWLAFAGSAPACLVCTAATAPEFCVPVHMILRCHGSTQVLSRHDVP